MRNLFYIGLFLFRYNRGELKTNSGATFFLSDDSSDETPSNNETVSNNEAVVATYKPPTNGIFLNCNEFSVLICARTHVVFCFIAVAQTSWLLRLFQSKVFSVSMAVSLSFRQQGTRRAKLHCQQTLYLSRCRRGFLFATIGEYVCADEGCC